MRTYGLVGLKNALLYSGGGGRRNTYCAADFAAAMPVLMTR